MAITLAFDIYGTLVDTNGVVVALRPMVGDRAAEFARAWRDKQIEYAFRRALMQDYKDFSVCIRDALEYACRAFQVQLPDDERRNLADEYLRLPPFPDVAEGLQALRTSGFRLYAFSNGRADAIETILTSAGIAAYFLDIISVDAVKTYKPSPIVYRHFLDATGAGAADTWLVSSNPFDLIGALAVGMRAAWLRRSPQALFDPWDATPTLIVETLAELRQIERA